MESEEDKIIKSYFDPSIGLSSAKNLYLYFNKKITLKKKKIFLIRSKINKLLNK